MSHFTYTTKPSYKWGNLFSFSFFDAMSLPQKKFKKSNLSDFGGFQSPKVRIIFYKNK
jgi:hypothetical protein